MDKKTEKQQDNPIAKAISGLKLRGIGPAVMGGRIIDLAVHPSKCRTWYVAAGSGGVWKTRNAGTTWQAIFEQQASYSIGCVTIDPTNPDVVWVGTGEKVSGRHVGWGDGVYRSRDGGASWQCMGLKTSQHIGKILIDPRDGDVIYVAAEGPLWSAGGERGVYKSVDGGESWKLILEIDEHTGVTDLKFDPANPDILYAAAYQRRRHTSSFLAGGPSSGIYKSTNAGESWRRLEKGLPKGDMGRIGLSVSPVDPSVVYATIEANENEKGFYRSLDRGESWEKRNAYLSSGTGPHYYQIIEASPHNVDVVYQMDVFVHVTRDGGKTFSNIENAKAKHSDNHALWIDPNDADHLLIATDAGLYESFDEGKSLRHFPNMPLSQFYRVALDNSVPFYNILGGAQDLGTLFGPSRTMNSDGVRNRDWDVPFGADGYHVAFDPEDPNIFYVEFQVGNMFRYDRRSGETLDIKPLPEPGEPPERWNWDTPILISPHHAQRLYVGSQRLWRSDNRGDSWTAVSGDLTQNLNRYELAMMGRVWSVDDLYDNMAMSQYSTITALSESPLVEGLLYVGTDDGLIQVSEACPEPAEWDSGESWRVAAKWPNVPERAFINDVEASLHDANTVFAVVDAHKIGDLSPYLFESSDRGRTWRSIVGDLPAGTIIWGIQQDHEVADLLFLATEFGLYFTPNRGSNWHKLSAGVPTIAFRDLKLQRRDNDLVGASFGRGFYVLDDYSPLREMAAGALENKAHLFPVRDAWWYVPSVPMQSRGEPTLGSTAFKAPNPPFGATFTYYLGETAKSTRDSRHESEKALRKQDQDVPFPGWERLRQEANESKPQVLLIVHDAEGKPVRRLSAPIEAGLHRITWDLRLSAPNPIKLEKPGFMAPWASPPQGPLATPGTYSVQLYLLSGNQIEEVGQRQEFEVNPVHSTIDELDFDAVTTFQHAASDLMRRVAGAGKEIERSKERLRYIEAALIETPHAELALFARLTELRTTLAQLETHLLADPIRQKLSEPAVPSIQQRIQRVVWGHWYTRQMPTATQRHSFKIASDEFEQVREALTRLIKEEFVGLEAELEEAGAPWTPGR